MRFNFVSLLVLPVALTASLAVAENSSPAFEPNTMQAAAVLPVAMHAAMRAAAPAGIRVSTGVLKPTLLAPLSVNIKSADVLNSSMVVSLTVDAQGLPHDIAVVQSAGSAAADAKVVAAVSASRFKPAHLDDEAVAVPMTLTVVIK